MNEISSNQKVQEDQYSFPYHYIPQYKNGFSSIVYSGFGINYVSTIEFLFDKLYELEFSSICDVGSGDGRLVKEISERFPEKKVYGIDYSKRAINLAKGINPSLKFIRTDIVDTSIKEKFDVLTIIEVLEHIPIQRVDKFIQALHGMLKENGVLILTVPHANQSLSDKHYQHFTSQGLKSHFSKLFTVEEEIFFEKSKNWRVYLIKRLMKNKLFILNNKKTLNWIYKVYKKRCFYSNEKMCRRIYLKLRKN